MSKVKYTVDKDGFINLNTKYVDQLVIVENEADKSVKTSLLKQIKVSTKKATLKKGKNLNVAPTLPDVIAVVPNFSASNTYKFGDETMLAMVTYKSSNSSVASVNKDGKVTITVTINLQNGKKTTFKKTVTVK